MPQYQSLIMIALLVVGFYFLILRPQKKRQQAVQKTLRELQPGTRVLLNSGLFGTIAALGDRQAVIEIAPGVEITVLKAAIARAVTETDEDQAYDDEDEIEEPEHADETVAPTSTLDLPPTRPTTSTSGSTTTTPGSTSATSDAYQPSSTYSASETESTSSGPEPTSPTSR
jgi:preprotein translocase subunit YajC